MNILLGLGSALCWGCADFMAASATRLSNAVRTLILVQLLALLMFVVLWFVRGDSIPAHEPLLHAFGIGLAYASGTLLLYRALAIGKLAIVSPIVSAYAIVSGVLAYFHGAKPAQIVVVGTVLLVGGMVLISYVPENEKKSALRGVPEALGANVLLGVYYWYIQFPTREIGPHWSTAATRLTAVVLGCVVLLFYRSPALLARTTLAPRALAFMFAAALLDNAAFLLFHQGMRLGHVTVTLLLSSQFGAVTMALGWILMRERISRIQAGGVLLILLGILFVSA